MVLDGLQPERTPPGHSMRIVAALPDGSVQPLVWLHGYDNRFPHPFLLRRPLRLPAGSVIRGVSSDAVVALIPAFRTSLQGIFRRIASRLSYHLLISA
jgi:hypothetical protein